MKLFKKLKDKLYNMGFEDMIIYILYAILIISGLSIFGIGALIGRFVWR